MKTHYHVSATMGKRNEDGDPASFNFHEMPLDMYPMYPGERLRVCSCCGSEVYIWPSYWKNNSYVGDKSEEFVFQRLLQNYGHLGLVIVIGAPTNKFDEVTANHIIETKEIDGELITFKYVLRTGD